MYNNSNSYRYRGDAMQTTKYSRQRETLLEILRDTKCHPNADWLYEKVRGEIPNISLGTVYRNLSKLSSEGTIRKIEVGSGGVHFDADISPHAHLVCEKCERILDIYTDYTEMLRCDAEQKTRARVSNCSVLFDGLCEDCAGEKM